MINSAAISVLMVFMFGFLECHGNKTAIRIDRLDSKKAQKKLTGLGYELAHDIAMNSSKFKDFFEKYEIKFDKALITYENAGNAIVYANFLLTHENVSSYPLIILGPHTPEDATPVLQLTAHYKKLMVTYLATPSKMEEPSTFGHGVTFEPKPVALNGAKVEMLRYFGWKRVAIVYDFLTREGRYLKIVEDLALNSTGGSFSVIAFEAINVRLGTNGAFDLHDAINESLQKLKKKDAKIFFGEFDALGASLVFCELYKLKMFGREYVWILNPDAGTVKEWVVKAEHEQSKGNKKLCSKEQYLQVVKSTFLLADIDFKKEDVNTPTDSGLTLKEFFDKKQLANYNSDEKLEVATAFDVMWAVMLALKGASKNFTIENNSEKVKGDKTVTEALVNMLKSSNFEGLTGLVYFNNGVRQGITYLRQYQDGEEDPVRVGEHSARAKKGLQLYNATKYSLWRDGRIPSDQTIREEEAVDIHPALFIAFSIAASLGIFLGLIFLGFNRYYRKYKFIRLSAPVFNDVMVLGCIMCLSTVFLFGLRKFESPMETMPRICKARAWILDIGFSLAFGAMFIKTWRIYKICTNKRLKVRLGPLSDWTLLAMVGGIVLVDVVTLVAWEVNDPLQHKQVNIGEQRDPDDYYKIIVYTLNTCMAENLPMWLALIYVYKGILLLYGLFLSYETRNVVYAHLNDSRVIGICVYNVVVLSMIGAFLAVILVDKQFSELYAALGVCIIFPATATICLIFIPKLVHRLKMESLDDESGDTTITNTIARPSIDFTSTYQGTEFGRERSVNGSYTNTLCVEQNGQPMCTLSTATSPTPTTSLKELSPNTLED